MLNKYVYERAQTLKIARARDVSEQIGTPLWIGERA